MKLILICFILFFALGCVETSPTGTKNDCFKNSEYSYCITTNTSSTSQSVVYFFHGKDGDEKQWYEDFMQVIKNWDSKTAPTVISISFGKVWLLEDYKYNTLFNKAIPEIESKLSKPVTKRMIMGVSMGGFNAASIITKNPKFFQKAMLNCPALVKFSPFNVLEIPLYILRTKADYKKIIEIFSLVAITYSVLYKYEDYSPFKNLTSEAPEMYVSCGDKDEYGFFEGAKAFVDLAKSKGIKAEYEQLSGGHCVFNYKKIAEFLQ